MSYDNGGEPSAGKTLLELLPCQECGKDVLSYPQRPPRACEKHN